MDIDLIDALTPAMVNAGHRVLQIHRFASSDVEHVRRLERWADFPLNSNVIDMGSGTGEVARILGRKRPDLFFTLVNLSEVQLRYSPKNCKWIHGDFLNVDEKNGVFDAVMFCFSIGHEDHEAALKEACRLLKVGGVLFVYDMVRVSGSNESMASVEYTVLSRGEFESIAVDNGFKLDLYIEPKDCGEYGKSVLGDAFEEVFNGTIPAIWRMIKC